MDIANDAFGELAAYRAVAGIGAAPADFMKMAIDALQTFLRQAATGIANGDRPAKARALYSAGKLVEFMLGLSGSDPGHLSECLAQVYRYIFAAILRANAAGDAEAIAAAQAAIEQLAAVWHTSFPDPDLSQIHGSGSSGGRDG
jgi:flagellar biosynthetic protein FliS